MQVRAGGPTAHADSPDHFSPRDFFSDNHKKPAHMSIARSDSVAVVKQNTPSVTGVALGFDHQAITGCFNVRTVSSADVDAWMECALSAERVQTLAKSPGNVSVDRPDARNRHTDVR